MYKIHCFHCKEEVVAKEEVKENLNIRADCPLCRKYIKFVEYKFSNTVKKLIEDHYARTRNKTS